MEQSAVISSPLNEIQPPMAGAGFWVRVGSRVIDTIAHNIVWYVTSFLTGIAIGLYGAITGTPVSQLFANADSPSIIGFVFALAGYILYQAICEYTHGASLGKLLFGIYVKSANGQRISMKAALIRSCAYFIDGLFFGIVAYENMKKTPLNQRLGDKWAGTVVVERSKLTPAQLPLGWRFLLAFAMAIMVDGFVALVSIIFRLF